MYLRIRGLYLSYKPPTRFYSQATRNSTLGLRPRDSVLVITPHAQRERGKVIGRGVHIYIYIYVCGRKKNLNRTLEIDSPFQTLTVGLLVEFID